GAPRTAAPGSSPAPRRRTAGRRPPGASASADVPFDVGQQGKLARALDRGRELTLVPRAHPRQAARQDLAALGKKAAQGAIVLVVEHAHPGLAHRAGLGGPSHASSSSISSTTSAAITAGAASGFAGRPSDTTTRNRITPSSSFTARSYSGSRSAAVSYWATT